MYQYDKHYFWQAKYDHEDSPHPHWYQHYFYPQYHVENIAMNQLVTVDYEYRQIDGGYNNPVHEDWGQAGQALARIAPSDYLTDGYTPAADQNRPSAREVSNTIFAQSESVASTQDASAMFWLWGQFIDHDLDLSHATDETYNITVPYGDPFFDPYSTGNQVIGFSRSDYVEGTGENGVGREQINTITPFIDASNVYGSDQERADFLRTFEGGQLKTSAGDMLPYNNGQYDNAGGSGTNLFLAGDERANENIALTSMHTIFMREHNRLAEEILQENPGLSDEEIYQRAKIMVEAQIQSITFNEFLPLLLGENAIPEYEGYDSDVDPQVANIFSTAAFRLGHTLLNEDILRMNEDGSTIEEGNLTLREAFFAPYRLDEGGIDPILRGFAVSSAEAADAKIIDDVRNFLFGPPGAGGFDLASLNIQRGRDHGLADYNSARVAYGLEPIVEFSDLTNDPHYQQLLADLYGNVNNIDVYVGGLIEDTYGDSQLGELFHTIVLDQFLRIRGGDSFWYENRLTTEQVDLVNATTLADIIVRNSDIEFLQDQVMLHFDRIAGTDGNDHLLGTDNNELLMGLDGRDIIHAAGGEDEIFGGNGRDKLYGQAGDDRLDGGSGHDKLFGGQGDDVLEGGSGRDKLYGQAGDDHLDGGSGHDKLYGGRGDDVLDGGHGNDRLFGGRGDDILDGGSGRDRLNGGKGDDQLTGGAGRDVFKIGKEGGHDTITDFKHGQDKVDLSAFDLDQHELKQISSYSDGNLILALSPTSTITLENVAPYELNHNDFIL